MIERNTKMEALYTGNCKINGIYRRWAQKRNLNYYMVSLLYILLSRESLTQKEFCENYEIPKQTIGNVIAPLKKGGIIILLPSPKDGREKLLSLTEKGRAYAEELLAPLLEVENAVMKKFGEAEMEQIVSLITEFSELLEWEISRKENKE